MNQTWELHRERPHLPSSPPSPPQGGPDGRLAIAILLAVALVGAVIGYASHAIVRSGSGRVMLAQSVVGPDGATIRFDDGGRLVIPRGALGSERMVTVWAHPPEAAADVVGAVGDVTGGVVYEFEPPGLRFAVAVTLILPAPAHDKEVDVVLVRGAELHRVSALADPAAATISVRTTSFGFEDAVEGPG